MKIAIISSASLTTTKESIAAVDIIIERLRQENSIRISTGGSLGVPGDIIKKAKLNGIYTTAYSPDEDVKSHNKRHDNLELDYFDEVKHFNGFTLRSLKMIDDADCVLVLNGRMGTLSEFSIALEEGKRVGVITETGGIADHLENITRLTQKNFSNQVFFSSDPHEVIDYLVNN
ncbi:MAG: hypothetical protein WCJ57_00360 [Candidatus Falkowbacteria bacterium]